jgi:hypothetical protein
MIDPKVTEELKRFLSDPRYGEIVLKVECGKVVRILVTESKQI